MTQAPPKFVADPSGVADPPGVTCFHCEYDLRGLSREGLCPECGSKIDLTWRRLEELRTSGLVPLEMATRRWLRTMMFACIAMLAVGVVEAADAVSVVTERRGGSWLLSVVAGLSGTALLLVGLWIAGAREPAMPKRRSNGKLVRWGIRALAILNLAIPMVGVKWGPAAADIMVFYKRMGIVLAVVGSATTFLLLFRLADAARRDARMGLRRWLLVMMWVAPPALIAQAIALADIQMDKSSYWMLSPHPVLGYPEVLVVIPVALSRGVFGGAKLIAWGAQGALSVMVMALLWASLRMFKRAAGSGERSSASSRT